MKDWQQSIGSEAAIALYDTKWWSGKPEREVAEFQMHHAELCMPFDEFHRCMEVALGRPVWTHEFGLDFDGLLAELMGERKAPTFGQILALIPEEKRLVVVAS